MDHVMSDRGAEPAAVASGTTGSIVCGLPAEATKLAGLWPELISGFSKVEGTHFSRHACTLLVSRGHRHGAPLSPRDIEILERSLFAGARKSVAASFDLCPSSIAEILRRSLAFMGLSCWPSRIPFVVVLAAHAWQAQGCSPSEPRIVANKQPVSRESVSLARPDNNLAGDLPRAECAVTRLLIEGKSYAEMAELRHTSPRTIANQVASAFDRIGVSGRADLLCTLAKRQVQQWQSRPVSSLVVHAPSFVASQSPVSFARVSGERR